MDALVPFHQEIDFYENAVYVIILSPLFKINLLSPLLMMVEEKLH